VSLGPGTAIAALWLAWIVSWMAAALWAARTEKRLVSWEVGFYNLCVTGGAILSVRGNGSWAIRLWHTGPGAAWAFAAATLAGLLFTWWARIHLGRLWSGGTITRKEGHHIIATGPYGLVRHPIYTGLIAALLATAAAQGTAAALLGWALVALGLCARAFAEERFLADELGAEAYARYRRRVPMLIPLTRPGR
jgi:protein-S-isoprenylcysteine O-methyltransferase Ste14